MPSFPTPEPITLRAEIAAGDLEIIASDRTDTSVEVQPRRSSDADYAAETLVEFVDGTLSVIAPERSGLRRTPSIRVVVSLPTGSRVTAKTSSADILAGGTLQDVRATTASGDVTIERANDVRIKVSSGDVRCDVIEGDAVVDCTSGEVRIGVVHGDAELKTSSGDVDLRRAGGEVIARSASGDLEIGSFGRGRLAANTASGDISVAVVHGPAAWLDVSSLSGKVRSDLARGEQPAEGEESVEITARSLSGNITITRTGA